MNNENQKESMNPKILNIIQCSNLGGMERSNLARLEALNQCGYGCHLISLNAYGDLLPLLEKSPVSHEAFNYAHEKIRTLFRLKKLLKNHEYDGVICTGHNLMVALAAPRRRKNKQVLCIHFHHKGVKPNLFWKLFYGLALIKFGHIFFNSSFIRSEAMALLPAIGPQSSVLPNIYDRPQDFSEEERKEARRELNCPEDATVICNAGWLIPRKRFDVFLKTAALLSERRENCYFLIAGGGSEQDSLKALASDLGIEDRVIWVGWMEEVHKVYAVADVLLFNTDWDAVARTPIEAGLRGVNLVCSEVHGGLKDLFDHPSWILSEHDCDALAEQVLNLLDDKDKRERQIVDIRSHLLKKCSSDAHVSALIEKMRIPSGENS